MCTSIASFCENLNLNHYFCNAHENKIIFATYYLCDGINFYRCKENEFILLTFETSTLWEGQSQMQQVPKSRDLISIIIVEDKTTFRKFFYLYGLSSHTKLICVIFFKFVSCLWFLHTTNFLTPFFNFLKKRNLNLIFNQRDLRTFSFSVQISCSIG